MEICAAETATDDQIKYLSALADRPFYQPVLRIGEAAIELTQIPYEPLPGAAFWYDTNFARLDNYGHRL